MLNIDILIQMYGLEIIQQIPECILKFTFNDHKFWSKTLSISKNNEVDFLINSLGLGHYIYFMYDIELKKYYLANESGYRYKEYLSIEDCLENLEKHDYNYENILENRV